MRRDSLLRKHRVNVHSILGSGAFAIAGIGNERVPFYHFFLDVDGYFPIKECYLIGTHLRSPHKIRLTFCQRVSVRALLPSSEGDKLAFSRLN